MRGNSLSLLYGLFDDFWEDGLVESSSQANGWRYTKKTSIKIIHSNFSISANTKSSSSHSSDRTGALRGIHHRQRNTRLPALSLMFEIVIYMRKPLFMRKKLIISEGK